MEKRKELTYVEKLEEVVDEIIQSTKKGELVQAEQAKTLMNLKAKIPNIEDPKEACNNLYVSLTGAYKDLVKRIDTNKLKISKLEELIKLAKSDHLDQEEREETDAKNIVEYTINTICFVFGLLG